LSYRQAEGRHVEIAALCLKYVISAAADEARQIATKRMVDEAEALGANAIVGVRYGSSAVMHGAAEVVAYGTAVKIS
ncbi:MAG: heavy metal-binding domain-containing protein, partial [Treponema sp.]|nr:heavy metal-binding domain-containing protein [Treponema sp.]